MDKHLEKKEKLLKHLEKLKPKIIATIFEEIDTEEYKDIKEAKWEYWAFTHFPDGGQFDSKEYYGPAFSWYVGGDQHRVPFTKENINKEVLDYWKERSFNTKNPFLYHRYADLIIEYHNLGKEELEIDKYVSRMVKGVIELTHRIKLEDKNDILFFEIVDLIKRSIDNLLTINENARELIELAKQSLKLEEEFGEDGKAGTWGQSANFFLFNKKISEKIDEELRDKIYSNISSRIERIVNSKKQSTETLARTKAENFDFKLKNFI